MALRRLLGCLWPVPVVAVACAAMALIVLVDAHGQQPPPVSPRPAIRPAATQSASAPARWTHGPPQDAGYFPIAVWLQDPAKAKAYKAAGFNLYVGLWKGPTEEQLAALTAADMPVICDQNAVGLRHVKDRIIVGWMHGDEPDNAQALPTGEGYGPPVAPDKIVADYERIRSADPSRPVMLNLGQGVAWDGWYGRGVRTNHPEDYARYAKGCDIASFDIYPVVHDHPAVGGKLWFVAQGVTRLRQWAGEGKTVWNCIECTRISNLKAKPTPQQVRAEVWMSIIHGSRGLIYFVHQFKPTFNEHALLDDGQMLTAVTALNRQVHSLAAVINSPAGGDSAAVESANRDVPVAILARKHQGATYVFAVAMRDGETTATITLKGSPGASATVLDEDRDLPVKDARLADRFKGYEVHLYRVKDSR